MSISVVVFKDNVGSLCSLMTLLKVLVDYKIEFDREVQTTNYNYYKR